MRPSLGMFAALALLGFSSMAMAQTPPVEGNSGAATAADPAAAPDEAEANIDQAAQDMSDLSDLVEEDSDVEARADEVFTPDEEISEDYPVPLPSDI
jgi:hypothetical protein